LIDKKQFISEPRTLYFLDCFAICPLIKAVYTQVLKFFAPECTHYLRTNIKNVLIQV